MTAQTCRHLSESAEAWAIDPVTGQQSAIKVYLCGWADAHPERFIDAPRWLTVWGLAGGPNFQPMKHCPGCPGFDAMERDQ